MSLSCAIDFRQELALVKPSGEVDLNTAPLLRDAVDAAISQPGLTWIDIDLADVTFLDSTGIAVLVASHTAASARGITMRVLRPHPVARTLLEVVGLLDLLIAKANDPAAEPQTAAKAIAELRILPRGWAEREVPGQRTELADPIGSPS